MNVLFRCPHRHTTFPLTPAGKDRNHSGETYVVCLDCGKQFTYDWEQMRLGKAVDISAGVHAPEPVPARGVTFEAKSKLKFLMWASVLPAAWIIGTTAAKRSRRRDAAGKAPPPEAQPGREA